MYSSLPHRLAAALPGQASVSDAPAGAGCWRHRRAAAVLATLAVATAAGCTGSSSTPPAPATPTASTAGAGGAPGTGGDIPALVKQVEPSVVTVITGKGLGSGIIYKPDGTILTDAHVVAGATQIKVAFADGQQVAATVRFGHGHRCRGAASRPQGPARRRVRHDAAPGGGPGRGVGQPAGL